MGMMKESEGEDVRDWITMGLTGSDEQMQSSSYHRFLQNESGDDAVQTSVIVRTLRTYGSFYAICFVLFEILRRLYPSLFNIRRWVPSLKCELAQEQYNGLFSWFWKVFQVSDEKIFEQCGMDALCFIRALRFCRKLAIVGCLNAIWLIPLYATAADSPETAHLTAPLDVISVANLPNESVRFVGTIVAAYITFFYTMYLLFQEFEWYTHWRHKFLSRRVPRSYAVYVYGIPKEYQSSFQLANYFRSCSTQSTVLEAHVAMDIPKLEKLQAERDRVINRLERVIAVEEKTGNTHMHRRWRGTRRRSSSSGGGLMRPGLEMVESIAHHESDLQRLNREIPRRIHEIRATNDPRRSRFSRMDRSTNLLGVLEHLSDSFELPSSPQDDECNSSSNNNNDDDDVERQLKVASPQGSDVDFCTTDISTPDDSPRESLVETQSDQGEKYEGFNHNAEAGSEAIARVGQGSIVEDHEGGAQESTVELEMPHCSELRHSKQAFTLDDQQRAILSLLVPEHSSLFRAAPPAGHDQEPVIQDEEPETVNLLPQMMPATDNRVPSYRQQSDRAIRQLVIGVPGKIDDRYTQEEQDGDDELVSLGMDDEEADQAGHPPSGHEPRGYPNQDSADEEQCLPRRGNLNSIKADSSRNHSRATIGTADSTVGSRQRLGNASTALTDSFVKSTQIARQTLTMGTRVAGDTLVQGSRVATEATKRAGQSIAAGATAATEVMKKATADINVESVIKTAADGGQITVTKAKVIGGHLVKSAATMVPIVINAGKGSSRSAGFVVFTNLYAVQAALQMVHDPTPYNMEVIPAPSPGDIFWRNVGMKPNKQRLGRLYSVSATAFLCLGWSVPTAFIASLTEVSSLKQQLDGLNDLIEKYPWLENLLFQIAPLLLLVLNEVFLPAFLKFFATWEGFISSAMLEASLFIKLGAFMIVQTFFVSALTGSVYSEITNMIRNPEEIINLLSTSLPSQSAYFMQIILASTFLIQGIELLRLYPLSCALLRKVCGPRLTKKERSKAWLWIYSLEDPPEFWHAETFAQVQILYVMIFFVYAVIAPITTFVILFCFILLEAGYRYQFFHNYPLAFDTGGQLWYDFLQFILASMLIAQVTLVGFLILKQSKFAGPALGPLIFITVLFVIYINSKHSHVTRYLPSRECVAIDHANAQAGNNDFSFVKDEYLQPALRRHYAQPEYPDESSESKSNNHEVM